MGLLQGDVAIFLGIFTRKYLGLQMFYVNLYQALRFNVHWKLVVKVPNCCLPSGQQKGQLELRGKQKHRGPLRKKKKLQNDGNLTSKMLTSNWCKQIIPKFTINSKNSVLELHSPQCGLFFLKGKMNVDHNVTLKMHQTHREVFKMQTLDPPQTHENEAWFCSSSIRSNGFHWLRWLLQPSEDVQLDLFGWFWLVWVGEKPPWNKDLKNMSSAIAHGDLFIPGYEWFHNCWHFGHSIYFMSLCYTVY